MAQKFSVAAYLNFLDSHPEHEVMSAVAEMYKAGGRGIFSEKLIGFIDLQILGYQGLRALIGNLYETSPDFVEQHKGELAKLKRLLSKENEQEQESNSQEYKERENDERFW